MPPSEFYCKPHPETVYPDPTSEAFGDLNWWFRYHHEHAPLQRIKRSQELRAASVLSAYHTLATHPCGVEMLLRLRDHLGVDDDPWVGEPLTPEEEAVINERLNDELLPLSGE